MLLLKVVAVLVGLGISTLVASLLLYDAALAINFQGPAAQRKAKRLHSPAPGFCRPAVFLYQRGLAGQAASPAEGRVLRIRRRIRARRRAATS